MLEKLKSWFSQSAELLVPPDAGEESATKLRDAVGLILLEVAFADQEINQKEVQLLCRLLETHFGTPALDAPRVVGDLLKRRAPTLVEHELEYLTAALDVSRCEVLISLLQEMSDVDGASSEKEQTFVLTVRQRLLPGSA